jgi:hypothetical protein
MKKKHILVLEDDDATRCFIVGTDDPSEAEAALRAQEAVWFGEDDTKWDASKMELHLPFSDFSPVTFTIRGEYITSDGELPKGRGRIAIRPGFLAYLD